MIDLITGILSFLFTIMILSYIVGDNPLFRVAIHVFVGLAAGFVTVVVVKEVFINKLFAPMSAGNWWLLIPAVMGLFLLSKIWYQEPGRWVVAFLVGVGAAAAVAGALMGTLIPQVQATINVFDFSAIDSSELVDKGWEAVVILLGTVFTLAYFQFGVREKSAKPGRRGGFMRVVATIGEFFLAVTFGALFAGVLSSALTAMVDRMQSIVNFFFSLFF